MIMMTDQVIIINHIINTMIMMVEKVIIVIINHIMIIMIMMAEKVINHIIMTR